MAWQGRCYYSHFIDTHVKAQSKAFPGHLDREGQCLTKGDTDLLPATGSPITEHTQSGFAHCLKTELDWLLWDG